jgi:hypothetical protein
MRVPGSRARTLQYTLYCPRRGVKLVLWRIFAVTSGAARVGIVVDRHSDIADQGWTDA